MIFFKKIQKNPSLYGSLATLLISILFRVGVIPLSISPWVLTILVSILALVGGLYATYKIYQFVQAFFKTKQPQPQLLHQREIVEALGSFLKTKELRALSSTSKEIHDFLKPQRLNLFVERVAFGMQDKVEQLFTVVYAGHPARIQEALLHQCQFTDYSGRTFNCSAYEYAYWAKDTHMCRMLVRYMDDETKAEILQRVTEIESHGLSYTQNDMEYRSPHFDFSPLINALQRQVNDFPGLYALENWDAIKAVWLNVGKEQRNVPAHVAHEYCRPDYSFFPLLTAGQPIQPAPDLPEDVLPIRNFNEDRLPRTLAFLHITSRPRRTLDYWFPLQSADSGLGYDFVITRGAYVPGGGAHVGNFAQHVGVANNANGIIDLAAICRLDEVRTEQLTELRELLNPPVLSATMRI